MRLLKLLITIGFMVVYTFTAQAVTKPNFVIIMLDDVIPPQMMAMPKTRALFADQGVDFKRVYTEVGLCGPSRATFFTGKYAINHGMHTCGAKAPDSGWVAFRPWENQTLAVKLNNFGYKTALLGKYMNGYKSSTTFVPPGWDVWNVVCGGKEYAGYNYQMNENGRIVSYGTARQNFSTELLGRRAVNFIKSSADQPFFLYYSPPAAHAPYATAPEHMAMFPNAQLPGPVEADLTDKPDFIQVPRLGYPPPDRVAVTELYRRSLRSLVSVDIAVKAIYDAVVAAGKLNNTYFIITSDNGYHFGEHNMPPGKQSPYETDVLVPLYVRGPNIAARVDSSHIIGNGDFMPTIMQLAGLTPPATVDGTSMKPLLFNTPVTWRKSIRVARWWADDGLSRTMPTARAIRTAKYKWIEWESGERELYDLSVDPNELQNLAGHASSTVELALQQVLGALAICSGQSCRDAERRNVP